MARLLERVSVSCSVLFAGVLLDAFEHRPPTAAKFENRVARLRIDQIENKVGFVLLGILERLATGGKSAQV